MRRYSSLAVLCAVIFAPSVRAEEMKELNAPKSETLVQFNQAAQRMLAKGDFSGARTFYERILSVEPANAEAVIGLAESMLGMGQALDSTKYYHRFIQLRPADPRGSLGLARAFNRANRPVDALAALESVKKITGNGVTLFQERGIALDLAGRSKEAQTTYAEGLKLVPKNLDLLRSMALSFAITEDYQTALSLLQNVANEPGGAATIRQGLAMVYGLSGQAEVAVKISATSETEEMARQRLAYFQALPELTPGQKAQAVHLGIVPPEVINQRLAALVQQRAAADQAPPVKAPVEALQPAVRPVGKPIDRPARTPGKPQVVAMPATDENTPPTAADAPVQPVSAVATAAPARAAPLAAADRFWVQLAASPNRAQILQNWNKAAQNSNGGLNGYAPYMQSDMINFKPILRLVVGGFFDAGTAQSMIGRLKTLGVPAILKRNALPADPLFP